MTLVLIGDPKQAIYAFRGADVYAYLEAAARPATRATLDVNWRSDQGLIDAYDALFGGAQLGHEGIVYRRVRAAAANRAPRLPARPVTRRCGSGSSHRDDPAIERTRGGFAQQRRRARAHRARTSPPTSSRCCRPRPQIEIRADDGTPIRRERVRPGHVAVLVRTQPQRRAGPRRAGRRRASPP